ncbi:hypothetical protein NE237_012353 [Protea cynaroides]|uniref:Uncharacterized protein n=1 Tax=Protea cynaroides TaxID=273540 RepID=A0A9Q0H000_9MAGN|nr:hypothetical protein NE237_012353 [Protea cynaroides]
MKNWNIKKKKRKDFHFLINETENRELERRGFESERVESRERGKKEKETNDGCLVLRRRRRRHDAVAEDSNDLRFEPPFASSSEGGDPAFSSVVYFSDLLQIGIFWTN